MVAQHTHFKAFLTRAAGEIRTWLGDSYLDKRFLFEKTPQSQCHVSVSEAVDERVQHGGDHCVHHGSNDVFVMRLA